MVIKTQRMSEPGCFKKMGRADGYPSIALSLAEAFDTTPQLWLNLQINYDLWVGEHHHKHVLPIVKNGEFLQVRQNRGIARASIV